MPLTPSFSSNQSAAFPNILEFADTSTGTDVTILTRRVYIRTNAGVYLVETGNSLSYTLWDYTDSTINIDVMFRSMAVYVRVEWWDATSKVYEAFANVEFDYADDLDMYRIGQQAVTNPNLLQDANWFSNYMKLIVNSFCAEQAISVGDSIVNSQEALDRNYYLIQHQSNNF